VENQFPGQNKTPKANSKAAAKDFDGPFGIQNDPRLFGGYRP
jgi:hypothetical protein